MMKFSVRPGDVENYGVLLYEFLNLKSQPISERLENLYNRIDLDELRDSFITDQVSSIIFESLQEMSKSLDHESYKRFILRLIDAVNSAVQDLIPIAKNIILYSKNLKEMWLACEPMLDLVNGDEGWQKTLLLMLEKNLTVRYFLSSNYYYKQLLDILQKQEIAEDKLKLINFVKVEKAYRPPTAIYISDHYKIGLCGKSRPKLIKENDVFKFSESLPTDWLQFLSPKKTEEHYLLLKSYL